MQVKIIVEMDNAAFSGADCGPELARILRDVADHAENCGKDVDLMDGRALYDVNGNKVGLVHVTA